MTKQKIHPKMCYLVEIVVAWVDWLVGDVEVVTVLKKTQILSMLPKQSNHDKTWSKIYLKTLLPSGASRGLGRLAGRGRRGCDRAEKNINLVNASKAKQS